jgi:hypothetical protein
VICRHVSLTNPDVSRLEKVPEHCCNGIGQQLCNFETTKPWVITFYNTAVLLKRSTLLYIVIK